MLLGGHERTSRLTIGGIGGYCFGSMMNVLGSSYASITKPVAEWFGRQDADQSMTETADGCRWSVGIPVLLILLVAIAAVGCGLTLEPVTPAPTVPSAPVPTAAPALTEAQAAATAAAPTPEPTPAPT